MAMKPVVSNNPSIEIEMVGSGSGCSMTLLYEGLYLLAYVIWAVTVVSLFHLCFFLKLF